MGDRGKPTARHTHREKEGVGERRGEASVAAAAQGPVREGAREGGAQRGVDKRDNRVGRRDKRWGRTRE